MTERSFEIGLVGAGAISAGAYTGGVIDFMVHALDCWYAAKGTDPSEWTWSPMNKQIIGDRKYLRKSQALSLLIVELCGRNP